MAPPNAPRSLLLAFGALAAACQSPPQPPAAADLSISDAAVGPTWDLASGDLATGVCPGFQIRKYVAPGPAAPIVTADFNGDRNADIAYATPDWLVIMLGDGKGGFRMAAYPRQGKIGATSVGDFNGDRRPDLIIVEQYAPWNGGVSVILNRGDGTFEEPMDFATPFERVPTNALVADYNRDGKLDFALPEWQADAQGEASFVAIYYGLGNGTFREPDLCTYLPSKPLVAAGLTADLNDDGNPDLVTWAFCHNDWLFASYLGDGRGGFSAPLEYVSGNLPCVGLDAADFNDDGRIDLASQEGLFRGRGDGTFEAPLPYPKPVGGVPGDFNHDGKLDLAGSAAAGPQQTLLIILYGHGDGTFDPSVVCTINGNGSPAETADFNNDGRDDFVVNDLDANDIEVFLQE